MKAIRVQHTGGPEVMELVEVPVPQPKPDEAVVKVSVAGVNSIDGHFRDGSLRTPLPFIPGQEGAGVVSSVGSHVQTVKVGDRVAWSGALGSYAEYVAAAADSLVPVPATVTDQQAAAAMMHGLTAHYSGERCAQAEGRRDGAGPRGRRRRRIAAGADGAHDRCTRDWHGFERGESRAGARGGRG